MKDVVIDGSVSCT